MSDPDRSQPEVDLLVRMRAQQRALVRLAQSRALFEGDAATAAALITRTGAQILGVPRTSAWLMDEARTQMRCLSLYTSEEGNRDSEVVLRGEDFPAYFRALASGRAIAALDARTDPRTSEFLESYLLPQDIHSMLDSALRVEGEVVGVLCHETVGQQRAWTQDEIAFSAGLADQLSIALLNQARRRAEQALRQSEALRRRVFEASRAPTVVMDAETHCFLDCNPAAVRIYHLESREQTLGLTPVDVSAPDQYDGTPSREKAQAYIDQVRAEGEVLFEWRHQRPDGEIWDAEVHLMAFESEGHPLLQFTLRDITRERQEQAERVRMAVRLARAERMEAVGLLAGGVAHDSNNMLGVIQGQAELLLLDAPPDSPTRRGLEEIRAAARRSAALTQQLLAFARKQNVTPRVIDLNRTVEHGLSMLSHLVGEDIELVWRPGEDLWPVRMDPVQVDQVLTNLLANARDAIPGVGRVELLTRNTSSCRDVEAEGDYVQLVVSDNGSGMDEVTQARVFEPFFTTKELGKGTGLGLATVYGIVRQAEGYISVESSPGEGTTFCICLPRCHDQRTPRSRVLSNDLAPGEGIILLAEDEPLVLRTSRAALRRLGYEVHAAPSPSEALRMAAGMERLDLLVTDVVMPDMNGWDLARKVGELHPGLRCLFMSGYASDLMAERGIDSVGEHFIQKPFSLEDLSMAVREALGVEE